jgi:hypothetical protein
MARHEAVGTIGATYSTANMVGALGTANARGFNMSDQSDILN